MQVLWIVLKDLDYLDEILQKFVELKLRGATILDSEGMASAIMKNEGLFSNILQGPFFKSDGISEGSKTIFTVIPEDDQVKETVAAVKEIMKASSHSAPGFIFTLPVSGIYPIKK